MLCNIKNNKTTLFTFFHQYSTRRYCHSKSVTPSKIAPQFEPEKYKVFYTAGQNGLKLQHTVDKHIITCYTDVKWLIQNVGTAHGISSVHHKFCYHFMQQNQLKPNQQFFPLKPLSKSLLWNKALNPLNTLKFYSTPEKIPLENHFPLPQSD